MLRLILLVNYFGILMAYGQGLNSLPAEHKQLFNFIKLPSTIGAPILTEDAEKLKIKLSLEVLNRINSTNPQDMACVIEDLELGHDITTYHLNIISEMLNRYEYHESGYIPCKAVKSNLSTAELDQIKDNLWKNPLLVNEYPSGYCRGRAFLISKNLDDLGFKSKMITMRGTVFATYKVKGGYKAQSYLEHFANVVEVQDKQYVLDPMFTDGPVLLDEYIKLVTLPPHDSPRYTFHHQSYADKLTPPLMNESCQYNIKLLKDYQQTIEESLKTPSQHFGDARIFKSHAIAKEAYSKSILNFKP